MSKTVILIIFAVITIVAIWWIMNSGHIEADNGSMDENYIYVKVPSNTGYPTIHYYHQHRKAIVISPVIQSRYMEQEFLNWLNNQQINGIQYSSVIQQCNDIGYLPYP